MDKIKIFSNFGLDFEMTTNVKCELYVDKIPENEKNCIRFLWMIEPEEVLNITDLVINNKNKFDVIFTYNERILKECPNSILFPYGTTWVKDFDFSIKKSYSVSTLIGGKTITDNHKKRHELLNNVNRIKHIPLEVFGSINSPVNYNINLKPMNHKIIKNELFYSQFHISIENTSKNNWFTEKLIDCFQTKTIPIYIGCPNIGDFFDTRGMFCANDIDDVINICNTLNQNTYESMKKYVDYNYEQSFLYSDYKKLLTSKINEFLQKNG